MACVRTSAGTGMRVRAALQDWGMICHLLKGELGFDNKYHKLYVYILTLGDLKKKNLILNVIK